MNDAIKQRAAASRVKHWELAQRMGISEATLCRKMRIEFSTQERERILSLIDEIAAERKGG